MYPNVAGFGNQAFLRVEDAALRLACAQIYNDAAREITGRKHPEALGQPVRLTWPEHWGEGTTPVDRVRAGETVRLVDARYPVLRGGAPEDAWFELSYGPLRDETGAVAGVVVTGVETTTRVLSETALRQSEERFRTLLQSVHDYAIFMIDLEGRITEWTEGARRMLGHGHEVIGNHVSLFSAPEDLEQGMPWRNLLRAREDGRCASEGWRVRKNGTRFWANEITTAIRGPDSAVHILRTPLSEGGDGPAC